MSRIYPEQSTITWCEHCRTNTVHDTSAEPWTCQACAIRLVATVNNKEERHE